MTASSLNPFGEIQLYEVPITAPYGSLTKQQVLEYQSSIQCRHSSVLVSKSTWKVVMIPPPPRHLDLWVSVLCLVEAATLFKNLQLAVLLVHSLSQLLFWPIPRAPLTSVDG